MDGVCSTQALNFFSHFGFLFNSIRKQNLVLIKLNSWDDVAWCSIIPFNSVNIATGICAM